MSRLLSLLLGLILITVCFILRLMTEDGKLSAHVSTDLADVSKLVTEVVTWKYGLSIALWDQKVINIGYHDYVEEWQTLLNMFNLNPGDTTLNLAVAAEGGTVVAFEMGPPVEMLRYNVRLNPQYNIHVHHLAVSDNFQTVYYQPVSVGGCNGCNGAISSTKTESEQYSVPGVRLVPFLQEKYSEQFIDNICLVKIDTEGHDQRILADLPPSFRPPLLWVEWYEVMKTVPLPEGSNQDGIIIEDDDFCTEASANYFRTISGLGYEIFEPSLPLKRITGCANKYYRNDLLLIERRFLQDFLKTYPKIRHFIENIEYLGKGYEINMFNDTDFLIYGK